MKMDTSEKRKLPPSQPPPVPTANVDQKRSTGRARGPEWRRLGGPASELAYKRRQRELLPGLIPDSGTGTSPAHTHDLPLIDGAHRKRLRHARGWGVQGSDERLRG
eukprot:1187769-Prorocentrum_minimum.AAC.1